MEEMERMKEAFNIFVDSCEKAGVRFTKEENDKEWPNVGDDYWYFAVELDVVYGTTWKGDNGDLNIIKNLPIFKSEILAEKYYSIIDTINNIVDELGRPSWEDFEDRNITLRSCYYDFRGNIFLSVGEKYIYQQNTFFPYCNKRYIEEVEKRVSQEDLLWAFKKSMRLI